MNSNYQEIVDKFYHTEIIEDYSLEKIARACEYFWNPEKSFKSIHIAGTNGKWSTSKMIFQMLKESGKRVGVYTSPHNIDIRERFETEKWLISEEDFVHYAKMTIEYGWWLSYYEKCVLLAFLYFRDRGCEYAVIEVGMGWRLDATNVITPVLSIITSISYDHMEFLGNTLEAIAYEKWGIIKNWIPVILYGKNPTLEIIASEKNSKVIFPKKRSVLTNLLGDHQVSNARIAYEAGIFLRIEDSLIEDALLHIDHPGRLEYLRPNLLIDWAHNEDGMKKLKVYLQSRKKEWEDILYCCNLKEGKPVSLVLGIFPEVEYWNIVDSRGFYISDANYMAQEVEKLWKSAYIFQPKEIFEQAKKDPKKLFVVFGSLYMMGEFLWK